MRRDAARVLAALGILLCVTWGSPAQASHFRFGHIAWRPRPDLGPTTVEFTVTGAFRRSGYVGSGSDGHPAVGDLVRETIGLTVFHPGDGTTIPTDGTPLRFEVTAMNMAQDWFIGRAEVPLSGFDKVLIHEYPAATAPGGVPWEADINTCCRLRATSTPPHINNPDGRYRVLTRVDLSTGNTSPISSGVPIVQCPAGAQCQFLVPGADVDGDPLQWRLSTTEEAAGATGSFVQPGPPSCAGALGLDPNSGLVSWNTAGCPIGVYSTQFTIEDLLDATPKSSSAIDFLVEVVEPGQNEWPQFVSPPTPVDPLIMPSGLPSEFTIRCVDPNPSDTVVLGNSGLLAGMLCETPPAANTVDSTCWWTPTLTQVGVFLVTYTCTDNFGAMSLHTVQINVRACGNGVVDPGEECDPPDDSACPWLCSPPGQPDECRCQAGTTHTPAATSTVTPTGSAAGTPTSTPTPGLCGNGILDPGEQCDDGNTVPGDDCDAHCMREIAFCCNNTAISCNDDSPCSGGDLCCNTHCDVGPEPTCDGLGSSCGSDAQCGAESMCCGPVCGNGFVEEGEQCDDGAGNGGTACGCSDQCGFTGLCSDNPAQCCTSDGDCSTGTCCGNGVLTAPEECDDGNRIDDDTCTNQCKVGTGIPACPGFFGNELVQATVKRTRLVDRNADHVEEKWRSRGSVILSAGQVRRFDPEQQRVQIRFAERDAAGDRVELWPDSSLIHPGDCPPSLFCFERHGRTPRFRWKKVRDPGESLTPGLKRARFAQRTNEVRFSLNGNEASIAAPSDVLAPRFFLVRQDVITGGLCMTVQMECKQSRSGRRYRCKPTLRETAP